MPQVPDVHVQPLERDARGHDAVQLVGFDLRVEQPVAEGRPVEHLGLDGGDGSVALQAGEVAPERRRQHVSRQVFPGQVLQDRRSLAFRCRLGLFQLGLGLLHSGFERFHLHLADALDGEAQRRLLPRDELVLRFVPLLAAVAGEAPLAYGFAARSHGLARGDCLAFHADFRPEPDAARQAPRQLAGVELLARWRRGDEGCDGRFVCRAGRYPGKGHFLACQFGRGRLPVQQGAFAPGGGPLVCVDCVFEFRPAAFGYFAELLAARLDGVGQGACQVGQRVDLGAFAPQYVAYGALPAVLAVDVVLQLALVGLELLLQRRAVEVSYPAFGFVDFRSLLGCGEQGLGVQRHRRLQVHAVLEGVLLVAAVHGYPGVGLALARHVARAAPGMVLDEGFQRTTASANVCADTTEVRMQGQISGRRIHDPIKP